MAEKTFITDGNKAVFVCAACNRQHIVDVSKFLAGPRQHRLKITCKCGHSWTSVLEKRRHFRKGVNFPGKYTYRKAGKPVLEGQMSVVNLSRRGLKIELPESEKLSVGDWIEVEFRLDNPPRTVIQRMVIIKNIHGPYVGLAFPDHKHEDPDIGFYLMEATSNKARPEKEPTKSGTK
jgi:hypothetical protein